MYMGKKEKYIYFDDLIDELPETGYDNCIICGNSSKGYAFCKKCFYEHDETELYEILNDYENLIHNGKPENNENITCLICGKKTSKNHFCKDCYYKFRNKTLILEIKNCKTTTVMQDGYVNTRRCIDGHWVKSKTEREIDNYLFSHNIKHIYEKPIPIGEDKDNIIHPDFCLPNYLGEGKDVYIEHWGYTDNEYLKQQAFKLNQYRKLHLTVICTYEQEDTEDIETTLNQKLNKNFIKESKINGEQKIKTQPTNI